MLTPQRIAEAFNPEDLAALRQNVVSEFGTKMWPEGEPLDFVKLMNILMAVQDALQARERQITGSPVSLRWDFEEATESARIQAVRGSELVGVYGRLSETLVSLINDGAEPGSFAAIEFATLGNAGEYRFAGDEIRLGSPLLPEVSLHADHRPILQ